MRLNTGRVVATTLPERALGSLWVPIHPAEDDEQLGSAICLWLNSTIGLLCATGGRGNKVLSRAEFSIDAQRSIPVPKFMPDALARLSWHFEMLKDETLLPLPQMHEDPVRIALDDAVTEALGLDPEWVARVRRELSQEPSITNRRYGGLG